MNQQPKNTKTKNTKKISIGSDHAGLDLKLELIEHLKNQKNEKSQKNLDYEIQDLGTHTRDSVDYPDFGKAVGRMVAGGEADLGICICGSGIGISIAANKIDGVRAAVINDVTSARLARAHNDANVICLGARLIGSVTAKESLDAFLSTDFEGGRHEARIQKLRIQNEE